MELETTSLKLIPLSLERFARLLDSTASMERALGLSPSGTELDAETKAAMQSLYAMAQEHPACYWWYTNWQIVLKEPNRSVGSCCFMGGPDESGEVEIGYGIHAGDRGMGYMTEACGALVSWAVSQPGVRAVKAETDRGNLASQQVLRRNGFVLTGQTDQSRFWRLDAQREAEASDLR